MRTLSYVNLRGNQANECENLVLMCMDFRFHAKLGELIAHAGYREFDLIAFPGGSKAAVDEKSREALLDAIEVAISVHKVKRVIVVDHVDCRAYGGSEAFTGPEDEERHHTEALLEAGRIIRNRFPSLEIVPVYTDWDRVKTVD